MPQDDFLKQFQQEPPDDFANELLAQLKQIEQDAVGKPSSETEADTKVVRPPVMLVPSPQSRTRTVDRYWTMIASVVMLLAVSSILFVSIGNPTDRNDNIGSEVRFMTDGLAQLAWTPDGQFLVAVDANYLYELDSRLNLIKTIPLNLNGNVTTIEFIRDGAALIIGDSSGRLTLLETSTYSVIYAELLHDAPVEVIQWVDRSDYLLSASRAGDLFVLQLRANTLFEVDRMLISDVAVPMYISGITVHPDGNNIIATMNNSATFMYQLAGDGTLATVNPNAINLPPTLQSHYTVGGERIIYAWWDNLVVLDSHTQSERLRYALPQQFQWLRPLQLSENGLRVLLTNARDRIGIWDFSREEYISVFNISRALDNQVHAAMHPNGRMVAAIFPSNEIHLWQINTLPNQSHEVVEVAVNRPDISRQTENQMVNNLEPFSERQSEQLVQLFSFGDGFLTQTLWSPDGNRLIVTGTNTIRIYDRDLQLRREWSLVGTDAVRTAISNDGRFLATGSSTGAITIWETVTGRIVTSMDGVHDGTFELLTFMDSRNRLLSRDSTGEFVLLRFDGSSIRVLNRSMSGALASYYVRDWHLEGNQLRLVMMRDVDRDFSAGKLVNIVDFDLNDDLEAQTTTTAISGTFSTFYNDGQQLLVYQNDYDQISIFDSYTFEPLMSIPAPAELDSVIHIQRDRINDQILLIDYDYELYRYDNRQQSIHRIQNTTALFAQPNHSVALHPDGQHIALIMSHNHVVSGIIEQNDAGYTLRELANDTPVLGQIQTFITGPNNIAAASTSDGAVLLFDMLTGSLLNRIDLETWGVKNHDIVFDPTGQNLLMLGQPLTGLDSIVNVLDIRAAIEGNGQIHVGDSPYIFEREYVTGAAFDTRGQQFITGGSQVRYWNLSADTIRYSEASNLDGLMIFDYHPTRPEVATLRPGNYLRVFNTNNTSYQYSNIITNRSGLSETYVTYLSDGASILLATVGEAPEIYDATSGELITRLIGVPDNHFNNITLSDDGQYLFVAGDYGVVVFDMQQVFEESAQVMRLPIELPIEQIALSADNKRLFLLGDDGTVQVWGLPEN